MLKKVLQAMVLGGAFWLVFLFPNIKLALANHIVWEAPIVIEAGSSFGEIRDIQKDTLGNVYFAYDSGNRPWIAKVDAQGNMTKEHIWPEQGSSSGIADFKIDSQNNLHVIVYSGNGINSSMHYFFKASGSNVWEKYYSNYYFYYYNDLELLVEDTNNLVVVYEAAQSEQYSSKWVTIKNKVWGVPELIAQNGGTGTPYLDKNGVLNIIRATSISFETPGDLVNLKKTQTGWQSTTLLSNKMLSGASRDIALDSSGNIHFAFATLNNAYTIVYETYLKIDPNLNVTENTIYNTISLGDSGAPSRLALDSQERPIISFQKKKSGTCYNNNYRDTYYTQKIGTTWDTGLIEKCTEGITDIDFDLNGKLIAAYGRLVAGLGAADIYYKKGTLASQPLPSTTVTTPQVSSLTSANTNFNVSWSPSTTGTYNYDVEYRMENGTAFTSWLAGSSLTSSTFAGAQGKTYCFHARSNIGSSKGAWSADKCTAVPLDEAGAGLTYAGTWASVANANDYLGNVKKSNTTNSTLAYTTNAHYVALIGTKGPNMGKVKVEVDGKVATVDLYSSTTKYRQVIAYKIFPTGSNTHNVKVTVLGTKNTKSTGTYAEVDGVVGIVN